ncbi:MAG: GNAT family N-acetyltransferase [Spirochaetes bacterium]|nr:GNAT family N-acetyltransferase [Spirochaetota bacterium]
MEILIRSERILLAAISPGDLEPLLQLAGDERVMKFFPKVLDRSEAEAMLRKIINQYALYGHSFWKIVGARGTEFIGIAGLLHQVVDGNEETEISYRVLPQFWKQGYASEAALLCKTYARDVLKKTRIISLIRPENVPSQGVAKKLGAVIEKRVMFGGYPHDVWVY